MLAWGWRIPFLLGAVIAIWGIACRRQITESPVVTRASGPPDSSVLVAVVAHWRPILRLVCLMLMYCITFYLMFVYAASYLVERMHVSTARALDINTLSLVVMLALVIPSAMLSDRLGRKPMLYAITIGMLCSRGRCGGSCTRVRSRPSWRDRRICGAPRAHGRGGAGVMSEMLPARVRCTAVGIGYNVTMALFGGTAPLSPRTWSPGRRTTSCRRTT